MNLRESFEAMDDLFAGTGVSAGEIAEAEKTLNCKFAEEYRQYLREFGIAAVNGHELTGLSSAKRTNVVDVTLEERTREHYEPIPDDWYVVEDANIDDIIVWQSEAGEIFQSGADGNFKICASLVEYIQL